jgi:hypothetical protein
MKNIFFNIVGKAATLILGNGGASNMPEEYEGGLSIKPQEKTEKTTKIEEKKEEQKPLSTFDKTSNEYKILKSKLLTQKIKGEELVLSIHIPGTGGNANDNFPTRRAFDHIDVPCIFLDGPGSKVDVQPVQRTTNSLEKKSQTQSEKPSWFNTFSNSFHKDYLNSEAFVNTNSGTLVDNMTGKKAVPFLSQIWGLGKEAHADLLVKALEALEEDGLLPNRIIWAGHSRGAVGCVYAANKTNEKFNKNKTNIIFDFVLTDPVPGPLGQHKEDTFFSKATRLVYILYAPKENGLFFKANDLSACTFESGKTVVRSAAIPGTTHMTIVGADTYTKWAISALIKTLITGRAEVSNLSSEALKVPYAIVDTTPYICFPEDDQNTQNKKKQAMQWADSQRSRGGNIVIQENKQKNVLEYSVINPKGEQVQDTIPLSTLSWDRQKDILSILSERGHIALEWSPTSKFSIGNREGLKFDRLDSAESLPKELQETLNVLHRTYSYPFKKGNYKNLLDSLNVICANNQKGTNNSPLMTGDYVTPLAQVLTKYPYDDISEQDKKNMLAKFSKNELTEIISLLKEGKTQHTKNKSQQTQKMFTGPTFKLETETLLNDLCLTLESTQKKKVELK